jgi:hypothetical protein
MKSAYQFQLEQQQRRLGLSYKQLNKYDRKYNNINLIRYLQSLNPAPAGTGFYGTFTITNTAGGEMTPIALQAKLAYNNVDITSYITIASGTTQPLNVPIGSRLPNPSSLLQLKIIIGAGVTSLNSEDFTGFTPISTTENPYTQENTIELLVDSGQINGGNLTLNLIVSS